MTIFEHMKENMTVENLASIMIKPCVVNRNELFYLTSSGQLFPFTDEGEETAFKAEVAFLNTKIEQGKDVTKSETNPTEANSVTTQERKQENQDDSFIDEEI